MAVVGTSEPTARSRQSGFGVALVAIGVAVGLGSARMLGDSAQATVLLAAGSVLVVATYHLVTRILRWRSESAILREERARAAELLQAALEAHSSIGVAEVENAVVRRACVLLGSEDARIDSSPPLKGEVGCRLRSTHDPDRWLIAAPRRNGRPYKPEDERALEVLVATTAAAIDNAHLHQSTQGERRLLGEVFGSSSDGIFSVDAAGRVTSWNVAMERITGRAAEDAVGLACGDVVTAWDPDGRDFDFAVWLSGSLEPGAGVTIEVLSACNGRKWLDCKVSPMPGGGTVVVARDISAQREVEDLKADFLATVSHELRTPLTPIQGFLQTLLRDDASFADEERRRFYEVMLRQSERLERLIKDLLDATSLQDKDHLFFPEEVDWASSASRVIELFRRQDSSREFQLEIDPDVPRVIVDEQRAEQVLSNLLTNAVKYSPPREPVKVSITRVGDEVVTRVTDRGPGIAPAERERVFERFTRLGNHLTRTVGGAGLGLFIARRLVEGMGGTIEVDNAPTGGASFSFTLPASTTVWSLDRR